MTSKPLSTNGTPVEPSTVIRFDESGKSWESKSGFWAFRFFDGLSSTWEFAILTFGVFFFYSWYGICMETFFRQKELRSHGWYLTLVQFIFYTLFSYCERLLQPGSRRIPISVYLFLAFVTLVTMGFSNASLEYLNYPTQIIFKSCKLIPVLIGGILIQKKSFNPLDFVAAALMCLGLIIFMLADSKISPNFSLAGVFMLLCALVADAIIGNVQEKNMKEYEASNAEVIYYSYGIGSVYLFVFTAASHTLVPGIEAFAGVGLKSYAGAFVFSITGYLGTQLVLTLVKKFGAFSAVTVTSLRKAFSIILSFLVFSKPFSFQYLVGGLVVLVGVYLNLAAKSKQNLFQSALEKAFRFGKKVHPEPRQMKQTNV